MSTTSNHIAIIGMAGRFPGAADVAAFWRLLVDGTDAIGHFSEAELEQRNAAAMPGVQHVRARGVLAGADEFDAAFFGISPREAELMDPQHRQFLQCCWHTLEDAGHDPATFAGLIGVYAGVSLNTYLLYNLQAHAAELAKAYQIGAYQTLLGNDKDFMPTRVSYKLGLRGPSMAVQSACSTSLVAVAQACQALLSYQADICLAGGVSISFPQKRDYPYTEEAMASPDGRCRPFDADAQGTVFGHGVGVVALRRLDDALAEGDNILAIIRSSAVNNDGAGKIGFAAPSIDGQVEVIAMAHALAEVDPASISYVEAHGTGTPLGDPIEIAALTQAFRRGGTMPSSCVVGTAKGNVGHLDVASGVTGLIKTVLQLQHRQIPPVMHFRTPNPRLDLASGAFRIADRVLPWEGPRPLRAGVSAFGVGGTNAHVVLEEAPERPALPVTRPHQLLVLSARTADALDRATANLRAHLENHDLPLADVAFTLQTGRRAFNHRRMVVCDDRASAIKALGEAASRPASNVAAAPTVTFLFPGQGAQHAGMAAGIHRSEPVFRLELDRLCALAEPHLGFDLRTLLFPLGDATAAHERLRQTEVAQPALFIVSLALAKLWRSWGVEPQAFIGHSVGEYVAATLAGVMTEADALRLVAVRGRLIQGLPAGTMLSVRLAENTLLPLLPPECSIAAVNGPQLCVASGPPAMIAALETRLTADGIVCRPLKTSHAFHSAMMDPILPLFAEALADVRLSPPTIPLVSCVSGTWLTAAEATDPQYWVRHVRATVRFADAAATLRRDRADVFLEVGPGRTLTTLARQSAGDDPRAMIASLPAPADATHQAQPVSDTAALHEALGRLWLAGVAVDWSAFHAHEPRRRVQLPGYPFATTRFWIAPPTGAVMPPIASPVAVSPPAHTPTGALPSVTPAPMPAEGDGRRASLLAALRTMLSELSGTPAERLDPQAGFIELGFDSLLLTQVSMAIQSRFKAKVTFRQLLGDIGSLAALVAHLDRTLPPEAIAPLPPAPLVAKATTSTGEESPLEQLIHRQMEMMAQQLALLKGGAAAGNTPVVNAPVAVAVTAKKDEFKAFGPYKPIQRGPGGGFTPQQQAALDRLITRYTSKTRKSKELTQLHRSHLADPRVASGFRAQWKELVYPIITTRSKGTRLWDVDGNEYIDLLNGFGCILFGHAPDFVVAAVNRQMGLGFEIGPQTLLAGEAAKLMCEMTGLERATFCNTGSEAVMAAMRLARTVTGRMRIVSFLGDYHGTFDEVLARNVGAEHRSLPIAPGIPQGKVDNITVLPYGTDESLAWIRAHADELAAVLVEPVQSRHPALQPKAFVQEIRRITAASGAALIMDEVITGFRTHPGGAQALFGVTADLASYGKVIGGGMPIGVLCGNRRFMDALDGGMWQYGDDSFPEVGVTFFAGTFVRHPATMAAVVACLEHLKREGGTLQETVNARCTGLVQRLTTLFSERGVPTTIEHFSSWFYFTFAPEHRNGGLLYYLLRDHGVHIQEGFPCFLTTAHNDDDLERIYQAFAAAVDELVSNGFFPDPSGRVHEHELALPAATAAETMAPVATTTALMAPSTTAPGNDTVPLGASQHEVWLASRFSDQASCAYNESVTLRLKGRLDRSALAAAWNELVARHEALRAQFSEDGRTQHFAADRRIPIRQEDWQACSAEERDQRLGTLIRNEAETPFDLVKGPVVRTTLADLGADDHALVITAHHLICDGWSMNVVCDELGRLYSAKVDGVPCELQPTMGLGGYIRWQQQQAAGGDAGRSAEHWRQRFATIPTLPDLPTDHPRPGQRAYAGDTVRLSLPTDLHRALKEVAAQHKATLFTTLLSAFQALILRLTGQTDVVVGVPLAGQTQLDERGDFLVGHCANFLPLRAQLAADRSLADQLPALQKAVLTDFAHQDYGYGSLLNDLTLTRDPSRLPLTEVQFNLERWASTVRFSGLDTAFDSNPKRFVVFDLFINAVDSDQGLLLVCDFNRVHFKAATVQRWLGYFATLLRGFIAAPNTPIAALPLLSEAERKQILSDFNSTSRPYPRNSTIFAHFQALAARHPAAVAVIHDHGSLTYQALSRHASVIASRLVHHVPNPGTPVAVCLPRGPELIAALLGILGAGGAYVPLDPGLPAERLRLMLKMADVAAVVASPELAAALPLSGLPVIPAQVTDAQLDELQSMTMPSVTAEDAAYILFTSGSTGAPKPVEIPHRAVLRLVVGTDFADFSSETTTLLLAPLAFDASTLELWAPLLNGGRLVVAGAPIPTLADLGDTIRRHQINTLWLTSGLFHEVSTSAIDILKPLRHLLSGGDVLSPVACARVLDRHPHVRLTNGYGPTENTTFTTCHTVSRSDCDKAIPIGRPIANTFVYVVDSHLQPAAIGVVGELLVGGDGLARQYRGLPELTAERFCENPFLDGGRLYRTGDLVRWRADGVLEFMGRADGQVKIRGFRIELGEIEQALGRHPGIKNNVVVAQGDSTSRKLIAYVVPATGQTISLEDVRSFLRQKLPDYMIPVAMVALDRLPHTANNKIDRTALPLPVALANKSHASTESDEKTPHLTIYFQLIQLFEDLLNIRGIHLHDDFFKLGGDSLLAFRLAQGIEYVTGRRLDLATIFLNSTPNRLAKVILGNGAGERSLLVPVQRGLRSHPPFFFLHGDFLGGGYYCVALARQLGPHVSFYTLAPRNLDPDSPPPPISEIAAELVELITATYADGPYHIGGFCIGGVIAHEVVRQLEMRGKTVIQLTLIDASSHYGVERLNRTITAMWAAVSGMKPCRQIQLFGNLNQRGDRLREVRAMPLTDQWHYLWKKICGRSPKNQLASYSSRLQALVTSPNTDAQMSLYLWSVCTHRPKPISANIHLFVSDQFVEMSPNPGMGWERYQRNVVIHRLPGLHLETVTRNLPRVVEVLTPLLGGTATSCLTDTAAVKAPTR